ncbi:sigma-70 family RNA polymerase sigma factor [Treponema sp.]|uniref:sigma-70 family RNA polymerase sigma factor n=1 Tax=Treponema sp. TaxID=166 RepID=UPI003F0E0672
MTGVSAKNLDVVKIHLNEIKKIPLLSNSEETDLAVKAAAGDKAARDKLLTSNMRFVIKIASQYVNKGLEYEDLISEGYLGLIKALDHFDVSKGYHFISYAVWWIRQSIMKAIIDIGRPIRLPVNKDTEIREIRKACHNVNPHGKKSEEEELSEVALRLGMTKHHIRELLSISQDMISLDSPVGFDTDINLVDTIVSENFTPEDMVIDNSLKVEIGKLLSTLDKKSIEVLNMRFGLNGQGQRTLKEVGEKMNLSRERVRQIEKNAIAKIRANKRCEECLRDYVA